MKVAGINSTTVRYIKPVKQPAFKGIFGEPNISEKFRYGLEALDNNSILTVTSNPENLIFYWNNIPTK